MPQLKSNYFYSDRKNTKGKEIQTFNEFHKHGTSKHKYVA